MGIVSAIKLLALTVFTAVAIAACNGETNLRTAQGNRPPQLSATPTDCRLIEHQIGETEICGQPKRIVALGPDMLELLLALDVQPAGYADHFAYHQGDYDNPSQQIPYLGNQVDTQPVNVGLADEPSIEAILKVQPDLILGSQLLNQEYKTLSNISPTLLLKLFDVETNLRVIAQAVGRTEKAEELIAKRQQQIANAHKDFAPIVDAYPNMLTLGAFNFQALSLVTDANSFCASLIEDLGFQLVYPPGIDGNDPSVVPPISLEILPQLNEADSVLILGHNQNQLKRMARFEEHQLSDFEQAWKKNAIAQSLNASKAGRVYFIPAYLCLGLPGPIGTELYLNELREQMLSPQ